MKKRILLIEDDDLIRDLYKRQLEKADMEVDAHSEGSEGIQAAQQNHYDLVLLDMMLPHTNGLEILKKLKADDRTQDLRVMFLSNMGQDVVVKEGLELGAIGYLVKVSLTPSQMVEEVKKALG